VWAPTSGEGAAGKGGRFNPKGVPALYLALSVEGMLLEMGHGFAHRFDPLTICAYDVEVDGIVDLRTESDRAIAGVTLDAMACGWFYDITTGRKPPSWTVAERLISDDATGILVPSFARGARPDAANLVLWRWGADPPHRILVDDPSERLPRNQTSWTDQP
jgi:RES domain-containing protein